MGEKYKAIGSKEFKNKVKKALSKIENALKNAIKIAKTEQDKNEAESALKEYLKGKNSEITINIKETEKGNIYRPPHIGLGHEIKHAIDHLIKNTLISDIMKKVAIPGFPSKAEYNAVKFENQIRKGEGIPIRPKY